MRYRSKVYRVGDTRPSHLLYTAGIGALLDLPRISTIVTGLDDWDAGHCPPLEDERLLRTVRTQLGRQVERLVGLPHDAEERPGLARRFGESGVGVAVAPFPRWQLCPLCRLLAPLSSELFRLKHDQFRPDRTHYVHENCPKVRSRTGIPAVPARFLVACKNGHLDDFPWISYVHRGPTDCQGPLRMFEFGISGEAAAINIKCDACGRSRSMSHAFDPEKKTYMPQCRGRRPHLRDYEDECPEQVEVILLGASNSWFPLTLSTLSLPTGADELEQLVREHWSTLEKAATITILSAFRQIGQLRPFEGYSDEEVWAAVEANRARREGEDGEDRSDVRTPEWEAFSQPQAARHTPDFKLREVAPPQPYASVVKQVVLAERLREVQALIGFTRIESPPDWTSPDELAALRRAPLSRRPPTWVPAAEVRGEGIFVRFDEEAIAEWERRKPVLRRGREFRLAHGGWRHARGLEDTEESFPGIRYVFLHSFSHALMRQLALECGYSAASLKERVYARPETAGGEAMAGVLLYTAAADSEGTLGGLVRLGEPEHLQRHIAQALELVGLCASDPLCSEHPVSADAATLHGAACHACLFVPETSCERGNRYLDRATLVPTFSGGEAAFFVEQPGADLCSA